jgi:shikimate kinase
MAQRTPLAAAALRRLGERNLVLVGFMGTGKTAVGRRLAHILDRPFIDTDAEIQRQHAASVSTIFATVGECVFRQWEEAIVADVASHLAQVVSTGGGALMRTSNLAALRGSGVLIALSASPEAILQRLGGTQAGKRRPLLAGPNPRDAVETLLASRQALYDQADIQIDTGGLSPQAVALKALAEIAERNLRR